MTDRSPQSEDQGGEATEIEAVARVLLDADLWLRMRMDEMPLPPDAAHDIALNILDAVRSSGSAARNHKEHEVVARAIRDHMSGPNNDVRERRSLRLAEAAIIAINEFRYSGSAAQNHEEEMRNETKRHLDGLADRHGAPRPNRYTPSAQASPARLSPQGEDHEGHGANERLAVAQATARSSVAAHEFPQGEDHEAGIEAGRAEAHRAVIVADGTCFEAGWGHLKQAEVVDVALDAYLAHRPSPVSGMERRKYVVDWTENGDPILLDPSTDPATVVGTHDLPAPVSGTEPDTVKRLYSLDEVRTIVMHARFDGAPHTEEVIADLVAAGKLSGFSGPQEPHWPDEGWDGMPGR